MPETRLPNPNRYIVDNDAEGNSFFSTAFPESLQVRSELGGGIQRLGYYTKQPPLVLSGSDDLEGYRKALESQTPLVSAGGGANVWYNDLPPGSNGTMHRTVSFDIIIVVMGEFELTLSNGDTRVVGAGDTVIQRSTLHKWRNPSKTKWARMVAIVSECQPYVTERGEALVTHIPSD